MSATSKLVGFSATTGDDTDEVDQRVDVGRRRYLMRYVVGALGLAGLICVAAGVRVALARSAASQDDVIATLSTRPIAPSPPPAALPAQAEPPAVVISAPVAAPIAAAPAATVVAGPIAEAPAAAQPAAAAPGVAARASAKPATATAANAPPPHTRAAAPSPPRPQAHSSAIIQSAPF